MLVGDDRPVDLTILRDVTTVILVTPTIPDQLALATPLLEQVERSNVERIIKLSILGSHVLPGTTLGREHNAIEDAVRSLGREWTIVRSAMFMQNLVTHWSPFLTANELHLPLEDKRVNWVDVRDVAGILAGPMLQTGHAGREYDVTGPGAIGGGEICGMLTSVTGVPHRYVSIDDHETYRRLYEHGSSQWLASATVEQFGVTGRGYTEMLSAAIEHLLERPAASFEQFARDAFGA